MANLVTLDSLIKYGRGLDERLANLKTYPDSWIESKINTAYELVATKSQPFLNEEVLDLKEYIEDGTEKFEVNFDHDIVGWRESFVTSSRPGAIAYEINPDHTVMVNLTTNLLHATEENLITFRYYYYPNTSTGDQYFSQDIYHMVRHGIASAIFDALQDYEKRDNFDNQLTLNSKSIVNGLDYFAEDVRKINWNV